MQRRLFNQSLLVLGFFVLPALAGAHGSDEDMSVRRGPEFPVFGIVRHYFLSGQYKAHLSLTELRIDHMAAQTECSMRRRVCRLSLAYTMPIGNRLGQGQFELPLIGAQGIRSQWTTAAFGDYVAHFSNVPAYAPQPISTLGFLATFRF